MIEKKLPFSTIFEPFWGLFNTSVTHLGFRRCSHKLNWSLEHGVQLLLSLIWEKQNISSCHTWPPKENSFFGKISFDIFRIILRFFLFWISDFLKTNQYFDKGHRQISTKFKIFIYRKPKYLSLKVWI